MMAPEHGSLGDCPQVLKRVGGWGVQRWEVYSDGRAAEWVSKSMKMSVFSHVLGRKWVPFKQLWINFLIIMDGPSRSTSLKQWLIGHVATSHSPDLVFWFHLSAGRPNPLTAHTMSVVRF
jgi:hypothetical protein